MHILPTVRVLVAFAAAIVTALVLQSPLDGAAGAAQQSQDGSTSKPPADADALPLQVALARAGFSVGAIDGRDGPKTQRALRAFRAAHGHPESSGGPALDGNPLQEYAITEEDAAGPFEPSLPPDMMAKSRLKALPYGSIRELLAERFRASVSLLERLNPGARFAAGDVVKVPNLAPLPVPAESRLREAPDPASANTAAVRVSRAGRDLTVTGADGGVLFYAPVSSGSDHDPLPLGEWKVVNVFLRPIFNYNPDLFWDADPSHARARLPGGPNSPVGLVWIDLDKEHYGLHGTPEPDAIGLTQSHGCVRLTNWDALHLASLVKPGTRVLFEP